MTKQACAAQHMGLWMVQGKWINAMVSQFNAGTLPKAERVERIPGNVQAGKLPKEVYAAGDDPRFAAPLYRVNEAKVATVEIAGQLTKGQSSYGGASNVRIRKALRMAEADADVRGIMMLIDSPGGTVAGQQPMADEIARIARSGNKPLWAHAEDGMHSAALWAGVQAGRLTASPMTEIGSIGTVATVYDYSEAVAKQGVKVHVVSTGDMKGAFTPGTEITEAQLGELQTRVDELNQFFLKAVSRGRNMPIADVRALADGRDWLAAEAKDKGLIDAVMSQDDAMRAFVRHLDGMDRERQASARGRARAIRAAELGGT